MSARTGAKMARAGACSISSRPGRGGRFATRRGCKVAAMSARKVEHLLIGGGLASANCARWLREEGADGEVLLVGREPDPPYNRPDCSKGYMQRKETREEAYFRPNEWWQEQRIELLTRTTLRALDLGSRTATLSSG